MENTKSFQYKKLMIFPLIILFLSVVWGSISAGAISGSEHESLTQYLNVFFERIPDMNFAMLCSSMKKYIIIWIEVTYL